MKQLSLLDLAPPLKIIPFPTERRVGKVRHVAEILNHKHGTDATRYWRQIMAGLRGQLEKAGLDYETVNAELRAFHDAVQGELVRLSYQQRGPGGAA